MKISKGKVENENKIEKESKKTIEEKEDTKNENKEIPY